MSISEKIRAYHGTCLGDEHHRYRSWEHCYGYFRRTPPRDIWSHVDSAAVQLGFYLASWGMYRGSTFLLQHAYTAHRGVVRRLVAPTFLPLCEKEFGADPGDIGLVPTVMAAVRTVREAYAPFGVPTDTLVTKVLLGTLGCLPACDRFFIEGFKSHPFPYSYFNQSFVERLLGFCSDHLTDLRGEQERIETVSGVHYPIMKLVDMYFWQTGYDIGAQDGGLPAEDA